METLGFSPFVIEDWPDAEGDDAAWRGDILSLIEGGHAEDAEHFEAERKNTGGPRFRPEHVVGSGHAEKWPIKHEKAEDLGAQVVESFDRMRP